MGCDIHTIVEIKKENTWIGLEDCPNEFKERNYSLFAFLANVRNHFMTKGFDAKGFPKDISKKTRKFEKKFGDDLHSKSYLTLKELINSDKSDYCAHKCRIVRAFYEKFKEFGGILPEQMTIEENKPSSIVDALAMAYCPEIIIKWQATEEEQKQAPLYTGIEALKEIAKKYEITDFANIRIVFAFDN